MPVPSKTPFRHHLLASVSEVLAKPPFDEMLKEKNFNTLFINYFVEKNLLKVPALEKQYKDTYLGQRDLLDDNMSYIKVADEGKTEEAIEHFIAEVVEDIGQFTQLKYGIEDARIRVTVVGNMLHTINQNDAKISALLLSLDDSGIDADPLKKKLESYQSYLNSIRSIILNIETLTANLSNPNETQEALTALVLDLIATENDSLLNKTIQLLKPQIQDQKLKETVSELKKSIQDVVGKKKIFEKESIEAKEFAIDKSLVGFLSPIDLITTTFLNPVEKLKEIGQKAAKLNQVITNENQRNIFGRLREFSDTIGSMAHVGHELAVLTGNDTGLNKIGAVARKIGEKAGQFEDNINEFFNLKQNYNDKLTSVMREIYPSEVSVEELTRLDELDLFYNFYLKNKESNKELEPPLFNFYLKYLVDRGDVFRWKQGEVSSKALYENYQRFFKEAENNVNLPLANHISNIDKGVQEFFEGSQIRMDKAGLSADVRMVFMISRLKHLETILSESEQGRDIVIKELIQSFDVLKSEPGGDYRESISKFKERFLMPFTITTITNFRANAIISFLEKEIDLLDKDLLNQEEKEKYAQLTKIYSKLQKGIYDARDHSELTGFLKAAESSRNKKTNQSKNEHAFNDEVVHKELESIEKIYKLVEASQLPGHSPLETEIVPTSKQSLKENLKQAEPYLNNLKETLSELLDEHISYCEKFKELLKPESYLYQQLANKIAYCNDMKEAVSGINKENLESLLLLSQGELSSFSDTTKKKLLLLKENIQSGSFKTLMFHFSELMFVPNNEFQTLLIKKILPKKVSEFYRNYQNYKRSNPNPALSGDILAEPLALNEFNKNFFIDKFFDNLQSKVNEYMPSFISNLLGAGDLKEKVKFALESSKKSTQKNCLQFLENNLSDRSGKDKDILHQDRLILDFVKVYSQYRQIKEALSSAKPNNEKEFIKMLFSEIPGLQEKDYENIMKQFDWIDRNLFPNSAIADHDKIEDKKEVSPVKKMTEELHALMEKKIEGDSQERPLKEKIREGLVYFYFEKLFIEFTKSSSTKELGRLCADFKKYRLNGQTTRSEEVRNLFEGQYKNLENKINQTILNQFDKNLLELTKNIHKEIIAIKEYQESIKPLIANKEKKGIEAKNFNFVVQLKLGWNEFKSQPISSTFKLVGFLTNTLTTAGVWYGLAASLGGLLASGGLSSALAVSLGATPLGIPLLGLTIGSFVIGAVSRGLQSAFANRMEFISKELSTGNKAAAWIKFSLNNLLTGAVQTFLSTTVAKLINKRINEGQSILKTIKNFFTSYYPTQNILQEQSKDIDDLIKFQKTLSEFRTPFNMETLKSFQEIYQQFEIKFDEFKRKFDVLPSEMRSTLYGEKIQNYCKEINNFKEGVEEKFPILKVPLKMSHLSSALEDDGSDLYVYVGLEDEEKENIGILYQESKAKNLDASFDSDLSTAASSEIDEDEDQKNEDKKEKGHFFNSL